MLVARIGGFKAVGSGVDLEHIADDLGQARLIEARALVDAVTGVEAYALGRNAFERDIGCLNIDLGSAALRLIVETRLDENVGEEGIVDLHQEPGVDDRLVFLVHLDGERVEIILLALVVLVDADARRRGRRQEDVVQRHAGGGRRRFYVVDVARERCAWP